MVEAIRAVGLEPVTISARNAYVLKSTLYAYVTGQIPVILGVRLVDVVNQEEIGRHAVTVTGYSLGLSKPIPLGTYGFGLRASRIDKIYAHDDQVGPFARMEFDGTSPDLWTTWHDKQRQVGNVVAYPEILLIPLYHKIRIPFQSVLEATADLDGYIKGALRSNGSAFMDNLEWDIFLTTVNDLKSDLFDSKHFAETRLRTMSLLEGMPRFLWRCRGLLGGRSIIELLFDATDIEQGQLFVTAIEYLPELSHLMSVIAEATLQQKQAELAARPVRNVLEWFAQRPKK